MACTGQSESLLGFSRVSAVEGDLKGRMLRKLSFLKI